MALITILVTTQIGSAFALRESTARDRRNAGRNFTRTSALGAAFPCAVARLIPKWLLPYRKGSSGRRNPLYVYCRTGFRHQGLKSRGSSILAVSYASMALPFLLGIALSFWLFQELAPAGVGFASFSLFFGVAMSITAFPVLARILSDLNLSKTDLGSMALACAALGDVAAWCLLALAVSIAKNTPAAAIRRTFLSRWICALHVRGRARRCRLLARLERKGNFPQILPP